MIMMAEPQAPQQTVQQRRQTAFIASIRMLQSGTYKVEEGWQPNYVLLPDQRRISRINLMGVVIAKDQSSPEFMVDDGTAQIRARSFDDTDLVRQVNIGDPILLIGRPRIFSKEIYIFPEIVRKLDNPAWIRYRKHELSILEKDMPSPTETKTETPATPPIEEMEEEAIDESPSEMMMAMVKKLDSGDGSATEDAISGFNEEHKREDGETVIGEMLKRGQLFEIKGKLKVLE